MNTEFELFSQTEGFGFISLFNDIPTFAGYLMPKLSL